MPLPVAVQMDRGGGYWDLDDEDDDDDLDGVPDVELATRLLKMLHQQRGR